MQFTKFFPTIMMILSFCAGVVYAFNGDFKRTVYFISATALTWSVM
jgi:cbb3-type cytochrome oxidase subunit 3